MPGPPAGVPHHVTTEAAATSLRSRARVRAPQLVGRRWLNTGGAELSLESLRGRVVVLDFWTFCCVNCLHVLDELRSVEGQFPDELVLIGVHSPKFEHEGDPAAVEAAVERYAVHHPVLDDPELTTWKAYTARAWPTLVVIDPEGYVVASMSGEGHGPGLASLVDELIAEHREKGTLRSGDTPYVPPPARESALSFPGKLVALPDGSVIVSDTAHHQVVHLEGDLETERARWGSAEVFNEPQGLLLLPEAVAAEVGCDLLVADSVNHQVSSVRFSDGAIRVVAGTGDPLRRRSAGGRALEQDLSTPWDLACGATASFSPWPATTSSGSCTSRPTRGRRPSPSSRARRRRGCATAQRPRVGSPSRRGWPPPATAPGSGSPTPRPRPCAP